MFQLIHINYYSFSILPPSKKKKKRKENNNNKTSGNQIFSHVFREKRSKALDQNESISHIVLAGKVFAHCFPKQSLFSVIWFRFACEESWTFSYRDFMKYFIRKIYLIQVLVSHLFHILFVKSGHYSRVRVD